MLQDFLEKILSWVDDYFLCRTRVDLVGATIFHRRKHINIYGVLDIISTFTSLNNKNYNGEINAHEYFSFKKMKNTLQSSPSSFLTLPFQVLTRRPFLQPPLPPKNCLSLPSSSTIKVAYAFKVAFTLTQSLRTWVCF